MGPGMGRQDIKGICPGGNRNSRRFALRARGSDRRRSERAPKPKRYPAPPEKEASTVRKPSATGCRNVARYSRAFFSSATRLAGVLEEPLRLHLAGREQFAQLGHDTPAHPAAPPPSPAWRSRSLHSHRRRARWRCGCSPVRSDISPKQSPMCNWPDPDQAPILRNRDLAPNHGAGRTSRLLRSPAR